MEGCRAPSFRVVGFDQYSLNSVVVMMFGVMHFMLPACGLGSYFDNKEFVL